MFFLLEKKEEFLLTTDMRDYTDNSVLLCRGDIEMVKKIRMIRDICGCFCSKKKNFRRTRQLVTLNAASCCDSLGYSGDSFENTRHPLITEIFVSS